MTDKPYSILRGDCIEIMRGLDAKSIDAIVTDPPYGLEFMGKEWDGWDSPHAFGEWCRTWAIEALRVLKPGGHLLAFGGTRMYHRLAAGIEDAGFEIRDTIAWLYGSGFPKSLDVSKAIDKAAGAERLRHRRAAFGGTFSDDGGSTYGTAIDSIPITDAARTWSGFGTALKPAHEPIVVARKPLVGTVAANVLAHGTGALNIDGCRIDGEPWQAHSASGLARTKFFFEGVAAIIEKTPHAAGRWPANVAFDEDAAAMLDEQSGECGGGFATRGNALSPNPIAWSLKHRVTGGYDDTGGASRFFYCAKASRSDREAGLPNGEKRSNIHPTVKPTELMRWLVRLVGGQPGSVILDPFTGSGSTGRAAMLEGFRFIGIEKEEEYAAIAELRIADAAGLGL